MANPQSQAMFAGSECAASSKQTAMPSTFVTTDRHNFKETVQRLTGLSEGEKLPLTIPARNSSRGRGIPEIESDGVCFAGMKKMVELGPQKSNGNCCAVMKEVIDLGPQKSDGNRCAVMKNMIELGPQKIEYRLQKRRKVESKLEIKLGFTAHDPGNAMKLAGHKSVLSPTLMPSPISPLGADLFSSYSYSPSYSSTPTSCNQSSYMEEEVEEFCFRPIPTLKSEPKLLTLFPLSSSTQPTNN